MIPPIDESLNAKILTPPKRDEGPLYTKKGTLRKRRPKTKNQYFTQDTEDAIIEYVNETDQDKRNAIYNARIKYGFFKGFGLSVIRVLKCGPWSKGGLDEVV